MISKKESQETRSPWIACSVEELDSSAPEYLLIHPKTSLCHTSEFSGFRTHFTSIVSS
jgi:hypothetical protein